MLSLTLIRPLKSYKTTRACLIPKRPFTSTLGADSSSTTTRYKFPAPLLMIFESTNPVVWYSENDAKFDYYVLVSPSKLKGVVLYLKKHLFTANNYMLDITFFENNINNLPLGDCKLNPARITGVWSLYLYNQRVRVHIVSTTDNNTPLSSVDSLYQNANWLERESAEMYGTSLNAKLDSRRLLLNYYDLNAPFLKSSSSSSNYEVYYDFIDRQVNYIKGVRSEL